MRRIRLCQLRISGHCNAPVTSDARQRHPNIILDLKQFFATAEFCGAPKFSAE
jgi:hypothetical protein